MTEKLSSSISKEEAQFMMQLVKIWSSAKDTVHHTERIMRDMKLLSSGGGLNTERILEISKYAK